MARHATKYSTYKESTLVQNNTWLPSTTPEAFGLEPNYISVNSLTFLAWAFSDALKRYPQGRLITAECEASDTFIFKKQRAHRDLERAPSIQFDNYFSPFLFATNGKTDGAGLRKKENAVCAVLLLFDWDSKEAFKEGDKRRQQLGLPDWDFINWTGGRGIQTAYLIDAFPLTTEKSRAFFFAIWQDLYEALGSDSKAKLSTQLGRLPGSKHAKTGRISQGFIRRGARSDCVGKLSRLADILKRNGLLKPTSGVFQGERKRGCVSVRIPYKDARRRLFQFLQDNPKCEVRLQDLSEKLRIPLRSLKYLLAQQVKKNRLITETIRNGNRCGGLRLFWLGFSPSETISNTAASQSANNESTCVFAREDEKSNKLTGLSDLYEMQEKGEIPEGIRNSTVFTLALSDKFREISFEIALEKMKTGNSLNLNPLSEAEIERSVESAYSGRYRGASYFWICKCLQGITSLHSENKSVGCLDKVRNNGSNSNGSLIADIAKDGYPKNQSSSELGKGVDGHGENCDCLECVPAADLSFDFGGKSTNTGKNKKSQLSLDFSTNDNSFIRMKESENCDWQIPSWWDVTPQARGILLDYAQRDDLKKKGKVFS